MVWLMATSFGIPWLSFMVLSSSYYCEIKIEYSFHNSKQIMKNVLISVAAFTLMITALQWMDLSISGMHNQWARQRVLSDP